MAKVTYTQDTLKTLKKGDSFGVLGFTGMPLGNLVVSAVSKTQFKAVKKNGSEIIFDRATGLQVDCANEKYANKAVDEYEYTRPEPKKKAAPAPVTKKAEPAPITKKKAAPAPVVEEEDEDETTPAPKAKKKAATPAPKTKKKAEPVVEEDDDDGWEDA